MALIRGEGILLLYHRPWRQSGASTIIENIRSFREFSIYPVVDLNTEFGFPTHLKNIEFDIIILHYSLFGRGAEYELSTEFYEYFAKSKDSCIIAFFQDEYRYCQKRFKFINENNVSVVYTCVEEQYHKLVYGKYTKTKKVVTYIPGYVSKDLPQLAKRFSRPFYSRKIDVGYRARRLEFYMGKEAQEKHLIGLRFIELCKKRELRLITDIDVEESGRLYGNNWYRFMGNCRSMLGVESGVSIFDLEDNVRETTHKIINEKPNITFEELFDKLLHKWENNIPLRTISPRHFEAAAFGTCQILFEGRYSGVMNENIHFIPLKKDFSNFDEVIKRINDPNCRMEILENAKKDLILSGEYSYQAFISSFDDLLLNLGIKQKHSSNFSKIVKLVYSDMEYRLLKTLTQKLKNHFL